MYKKDYIIGIYTYDRYELCETILESAYEFAEYVGTTLNAARNCLSRLFHHQSDYIIIDGRRKKVEFISISDM